MKNITVQPLFSSFIASTSGILSEQERLDVRNYVYTLAHDSKLGQCRLPAEGAEDAPEAYIKLSTAIREALNEVHLRIGLSTEFYQKISGNWVNLTENTVINKLHTHPGHTFVAIYYPYATEDSNLVLSNLISPMPHEVPREAVAEHNDITSNMLVVSPEEDTIVIIPSWVYHGVEPKEVQKGSSERVSVVYNSKVTPIV